MKVVVVGAGLGGLSAAAHLVGRGHEVTIVERAAAPGGRAGVVAERRVPARHRPDRADHARPAGRGTFAAAGADMADFVTIRPVDPMYRAVYADGSELRVWHGRERDDRRDRRVRRRGRRRGVRPLLRLARAGSTSVEMAHFIDTNFDSRARPRPAARARAAAWCGSAASASSARVVALVLRRRAPAADLLVPVDVRRPGARTRRWRSTR